MFRATPDEAAWHFIVPHVHLVSCDETVTLMNFRHREDIPEACLNLSPPFVETNGSVRNQNPSGVSFTGSRRLESMAECRTGSLPL